MRYSLLVSILSVASAACGDDGAATAPDATAPDATVEGPDANLGRCDRSETNDLANDFNPEADPITLDAEGVRMCGAIDARAPANGLVDRDQYAVIAPALGDYLLRVDAPGADAVRKVQFFVFEDFGHGGEVIGNHGTFVFHGSAGPLTVAIQAFDSATPAAAIPYEITVTPIDWDARCAALTGTADYTEANDGPDNLGNDMVALNVIGSFAMAQTPDAPTADAPEPSEVTASAGTSQRITGEAGPSANSYDDDFIDRDTYLIATGPDTDEITVRVDWVDDAGTADDANLDLNLIRVPPDAATPPDASAYASDYDGQRGPERLTSTVLPSTSYWVWVGNLGGVIIGHDKPYAITVCGAL